jgi:hypothetical protein
MRPKSLIEWHLLHRGVYSRATESSRSNVIALRHTLKQMYGEVVATDVANLV